MQCPFCKNEVPDKAVKCRYCQALLKDYPQDPPRDKVEGPPAQLSPLGWFFYVFKQYAVFSGRAQRAQYWYFTLFSILAEIALEICDQALGTSNEHLSLFSSLFSLAVLLPSLGVTVRRLHDIGRSGWWVLILLIPILGALVLLVFMVLDSQPGDNRYGPNPKGVPAPVPDMEASV